MRRIQSLSIHAAALTLPLAMAACANDSVASSEALEEYGTIRAASIIPDQVTTAVATAKQHTCARSSWGYLKCWGYNGDGQLGIGNNTSTLAPGARVDVGQGRTVRSVAAGRRHTCAILDNNTLKCWGSNWLGQLGIGTNSSATNAPGPTTNLGLFRFAKSVAVGNTHTCAILTDDTVKCWGDNAFGQLGLGAGAGGSINAPGATVFLGAGRTAKSISTHHQHTCAVLDNDTLKCWGQNFAGALGNGTTVDAFTPAAVNLGAGRSAKSVSAGHQHTCAVLDNDSIKCWGENYFGSLGIGTTVDAYLPGASVNLGAGRSAMAVTAGGDHTCALLDNSSVKCWGLNFNGQVGIGSTTITVSAPGSAAQLGFLRSAQSVAAGGTHTCAVLDNASLKCWGENDDGQLGLGTTSSVSVPTTVPNLW